MRNIISNKGDPNPVQFAKDLLRWAHAGFSELGDVGGMGIGQTVNKVLTHEKFLKEPHVAAHDVWVASGRSIAPNGAVMRTAVLGIPFHEDLERVVKNTLAISKTTHADPRCSASCVAVTTAIANMLNGETNVDKIVLEAYERAAKLLETTEQKDELKKVMLEQNLNQLDLDHAKTIGYTMKVLSSFSHFFKE